MGFGLKATGWKGTEQAVFLIIALLALAAPAGAATITIGNGSSTALAYTITNIAADGDTIILEPGTYFEHTIAITGKSLTLRANTSYGHGPADTIIDGQLAGRIIDVTDTSLLVIDNLTLQNGQGLPGNHGGAIHSYAGSVTVTSSTITNCRAGDISSGYGGWGGAIFVQSGTATVISSTITGCRAGDGRWGGHGGAIFSQDGTVIVTSSTITGCRAGDGSDIAGRGGAIYTGGGRVTVTSSTITGCRAGVGSMGSGGAISGGSGTVRFCRLLGNTASGDGNTISGSIDARDNWWGSNAGPSAGDLGGGALAATWLVLGSAADPALISASGTSAVRANLTFNSTGSDTSAHGHLPEGIPVAFAIGSGTGSVSPGEGNITSGTNTTMFIPAGTGTSTVSATVDGETVSTGITVTLYPIANFTAAPLTGIAPLAVQFTDTTDVSGGTMWNWSFGDGAWENTTVTSDPVHTYMDSGTYTVSLTVTNADGSDTETKESYVHVAKAGPLVAGFTAAPLTGTAPLTVQFTDTSTGPVYSWIWNFGSYSAADAGISSLQNPSHTYDAAGTYTITLTVNNTDGSSTLSRTGYVTVTAMPTPAPTAAPVNPPSGGNSGTSSANSGGSDTGTGPAPARAGSIVLFADSAYLADHSVTPSDIRIMSYYGGRWTPLETRYTGSSGNRFSFTADTDTVSLFSIGNTKDGITGLPVIGGVVAAPDPTVFRTPVTPASSLPEETRTISPAETTVPAMQQPAVELQVPATAPASSGSSGFPFVTVVLILAGCIVLIGGGWYVRRWLIRRQNPTLFREYD